MRVQPAKFVLIQVLTVDRHLVRSHLSYYHRATLNVYLEKEVGLFNVGQPLPDTSAAVNYECRTCHV